ncbi:efflux transporter outer membrane subunit [Parvularcula dongshanensis]|uniref:NodT family efflux transporter outer membrane factor (OMF) lipoprotein n=1 Tax=Parvularcula dongshanensis TaxID=1173995 RepID=A0A840I758_9PROT|nr:efflux transporter outer membrane subunit [Parvularcula dongshanensis]MBB4660083.1 NodT family efflux transporter outer membrane factor (OMF) lipoprotein [Parvularcula dongshanensis]
MTKPRSTLLAVTALVGLAGCVTPGIEPEGRTVDTASLGLSDVTAPDVAQDWWRAFADPQLDRIVEDALEGNPSLDDALARLRLASAQLRTRGADRQPQIELEAGEQRARLSGVYTIPPPYGGSTRWVGSAQANLGWNLDLWGRSADAVHQAAAQADAAGLDVAAARLALSGAVAQTYVELARTEQQVQVAADTVAQRERALRLARVRLRNDLATQLDVTAAETVLAQAERVRAETEGQRALLVHSLARLAGRGADYYPTIGRTALDYAATPPIPGTLPADLLARRPDVLGARTRVEAALAGRQVARKAFYPNIDLTGLAGVQAVGLGNLVSDDALTYGAGAALHLPLFDGGRLRGDYEAATAETDRAIAAYNEAVLDAVRDAADALSRIDSSRRALEAQEAVTAGLRETQRLDQVRVRSGLSSRLELIGSDVRLLQAELEDANLRADTAISTIQLVVALGGGFEPPAQIDIATSRSDR